MAQVITVNAFDRPFKGPFNTGVSRSVVVGVSQIIRVDAYKTPDTTGVNAIIRTRTGSIYVNDTPAQVTTKANA